jgi:hypothetical protein
MGTGITSIALLLDGEVALSRALMWIAGCLWAVLAVGLAVRAIVDWDRLHEQLLLPASLSGVAGTCVLGARLSLFGWAGTSAVLFGVAVITWASLLPGILASWRGPTVGRHFLLAVSTLALSALASLIAAAESIVWLPWVGLFFLVLGVIAYLAVFAGFDLGELHSGRGDQWIAGGALAIGGLAVAELIESERQFDFIASLHGVLSGAGWVLWAAAMAWLASLLAAEAIRPRLAFDALRWSTVFPVGMYAAMSFALGQALHSVVLVDFAQVWVWPALALWALVALGSLRHHTSA